MFRLLLLLCISTPCLSQDNGILLLQKRNRTVGHYFVGSPIVFFTKDGSQITGHIDSLKRDSIFLKRQSEWMVPTPYGTYTPIKGPAVFMQFAISEIAAFPLPAKKSSGLFRSGIIFIVGGSAYLVLNVVNTLREGDAVFGSGNLPRVIGGLSSVALGLALRATRKTQVKLGGKYQLKFLPGTELPAAR